MQIENKKKFIINFTFYLILGGIAFVSLKYLLPLLTPFVIGFVFAYLLQRPVRYISSRLHLHKKAAAVMIVSVFYILLGTLVTLLGAQFVSGIRNLIPLLPGFYTDCVKPFLTDFFSQIEHPISQMDASLVDILNDWSTQILDSIGNLVSSLSGEIMRMASGIAASLPGFFIRLLLTIISTFFISMDYDQLTAFCATHLNRKWHKYVIQIKDYMVGTLFVCIRSYALIMGITFAELSIGLLLLRIDNAVLIALLIAVFDILPVVGTGGIMIPWAVFCALSGNYALCLGLLAVYLVITVVRNIIEPKIVGGQLGLHPVITLVSMFAGVQLFGVIGLFGFPIGLSLLRYLNANGTLHLFAADEKNTK